MINLEEYKETMQKIKKSECWNDFDPEAYEGLCEFAGLDYHSYDDPDKMWNDLVEFSKSYAKKA